MIKKNLNSKFVIRNCQKGMTYVELIVVLAIFFTMSSVVLFNYRTFQDRVNIVNLANDIGLKIVQAQKDASSGALPVVPVAKTLTDSWRPAYGAFFDLSSPASFKYFTDLGHDGLCDASCAGTSNTNQSGNDYLDTINITGGNSISKLEVFSQTAPTTPVEFQNLSLVFTRSDPGVVFGTYPNSTGQIVQNVDHILITLSSLSASTSEIKVYASGRIQIN